jgi:serine/threonine-protein kinase RsbW
VSDLAERLEAGDRVELRFPARGDLVVLARLVTSAISARAGFDVEELEDLRLAVGELCLLALHGAAACDGELHLELTVLHDAIAIDCSLERASASGPAAASPEEEEAAGLSEQILTALVDEHGCRREDGAVRAWLRKRRGEHGG